MSRTYSTSRSSTSSDDSDRDYPVLDHYNTQASDGTIPAALAISTSQYTSQASEPSIASTVTSPEQRPSRLLDVSNILNPTPQRSAQHSRATSLAHFGSPRASTPTIHHGTQRSLPPSPIDLSHSGDASRGGSGFPRRIAPGPPSAQHRHSTRHSLSGIISAQENPFPLGTPRRPAGYASDAHSSAAAPPPPHLPAPPSGHQSPAFPFPSVPTSMQYAPSSFSTPMSSASASPNTSYSTYVQSAQSPLPPSTPTFNHPGYSLGHPSTPINNPYPLSLSTHGPHGGYPMMSLNTAHGAIQIPIDTTAASKSADEKRKRNAGASARFRQRRKEREREMSTRISDLEQRVKKVEEERDYYRDLALRLQRGGGRPQQGQPQSLSPSRIGMAMGPGDSGFGGFRPSEISRPSSSMRDFGSPMTGIEVSGDHGQGSRSGHPGHPGTPRMRQPIDSGAGSALKRETEMYDREHHGAGGSDQRHH
ncbi:hypothetical protein DFP73DRAFT_59960 [Morchella snyderi]|nr:hypothetical protein DFP73DRAFT_59960 [Morchella snyderi]